MKAILATTVLALSLLSACMPTPGYAGYVCMARKAVLEKLKRGYGETPSAFGKLEGAGVIEVFLSPSGTFTVLITRPDGLSCILASGRDWQALSAGGQNT